MNSIVFYIRALFHESILPGDPQCDRPNISNMINSFDNFSNISAIDYRKAIHEIQIKNLSKISDRFIINHAQESTRKYNYTFGVLQSNTIKLLGQLDDSDIVIMMDDDDWLSPEVAKINFQNNALNCWNSSSFAYADPTNVQLTFNTINRELPKILETDEHRMHAGQLLSNCQAIPAYVIKNLININKIDTLQILLQRHNLVRALIRTSPIIDMGIQEKLFSDILAVYVRHAANVTLFQTMGTFASNTFTEEAYNTAIYPYKFADYNALTNLPDFLMWSKPYLSDLQSLNQLL